MIFYTGTALNKDEMAFFEKYDHELQSWSLPVWWRQGDTLRFAHAVKFDIDKTRKVETAHPACQGISCLHTGS